MEDNKITRKYLLENGFKEWPSYKTEVESLISKNTEYFKGWLTVVRRSLIDPNDNGKLIHDMYEMKAKIDVGNLKVEIKSSGDKIESISEFMNIVSKWKSMKE